MEVDYKKISRDVGLLEQFYAEPANINKLYQLIIQVGDQNTTLPCLLAIPPHVLEFCITGQHTPFQFLQKITQMATADGSLVTMLELSQMATPGAYHCPDYRQTLMPTEDIPCEGTASHLSQPSHQQSTGLPPASDHIDSIIN